MAMRCLVPHSYHDTTFWEEIENIKAEWRYLVIAALFSGEKPVRGDKVSPCQTCSPLVEFEGEEEDEWYLRLETDEERVVGRLQQLMGRAPCE